MPSIASGKDSASGQQRRATAWRWPFLFLVWIALTSGCCRSIGPTRHEVQKPILPATPTSVDLPIEISYPDIPEVPEKIQGPSPPIGEPAAGKPGK